MQDDEGIKHENKTVGTHGESDQRDNQRYPISIFIPQTIIEEYRANEKENRARDKRRYRLEKIAVVVAAIYAVFTYELWNVTQQQATATITQAKLAETNLALLQIAERANIDLGGPDKVLAERKDKDTVILHFFNSGKTEAKDLAVESWTNPKGPFWIQHRRRYQQFTRFRRQNGKLVLSGQWLKGGIMRNGGLRGAPVDVCAQCQYSLDIDTAAMIINNGAGKPQTRVPPPKPLEIKGEFEYCDIFGGYQCKPFTIDEISPGRFERRYGFGFENACRPDTPFGAGLSKEQLDFMRPHGEEVKWLTAFRNEPIARCPRPEDPDYHGVGPEDISPPDELLPP